MNLTNNWIQQIICILKIFQHQNNSLLTKMADDRRTKRKRKCYLFVRIGQTVSETSFRPGP